MKKIFLIAALIITGLSFQARSQDYYNRGYNDSYNYGGYDNGGFGYFYTSLSPYGSWIEFGDGVYGWKPINMRIGWAPYANGRWIWTSDGWYWDSYEPFGYIVYHYGRWYFDDYYGWIWIPDYQWAPAWVEWRYDNDYIGWAPLPPYAVFSISIGIHFTHTYYTPYSHWFFVKYHYFCDPYVVKYYVAPKYKYRIYSKTKYRNDYGFRNGRVVNRGIDVNLIRERGKIDIRERNIRTVSNLRDINDNNRLTNDEIRTFIPDRKNFTGSGVKDMKIERTNRNTTLETSKLKFGRTNVQRKDVSGVRKNDTKTTQDVNRTPQVRQETNTQRQSVDQNRKTEQKTIVPDTRSKTNDRKEVKTPVRKDPVKKESGTVTAEKRVPPQVDNRTNQNVQQNTRQRKEIRTTAPPVQKRNEVKVNQSQNNSRGSTGNSVKRNQTESRTRAETKKDNNNGRTKR